MKERPILFSGPMVRALLDGSKTQTRRVVKPRKDHNVGCMLTPRELAGEVNNGEWSNSPYGQPGDRLYVRETCLGWWMKDASDENAPRVFSHVAAYAADGYQLEHGEKWIPSIHMPRIAARIHLEITGVRIEKLQVIDETDARAEGARECDPASGREVILAGPSQRGSYVLHYRDIWDGINAARGYGWDANPWVWVIEFKRIDS